MPVARELTRLVELIRSGNVSAAEELKRLLQPGVRFLIGRRHIAGDMEAEVHWVLDAALHRMESDPGIDGAGVPRVVRQIIQQRYARKPQSNEIPAGDVSAGVVEAVQATLGLLTPIEREALRRSYILGEGPELFLHKLQMTPADFASLRVRARAEFHSRRTASTGNVA